MENDQPATLAPRPVQTILSERAILDLEVMLHWFNEELACTPITDYLMEILAVYIKAKPNAPHMDCDRVIRFISKTIQLCEQLMVVDEVEGVGWWIGTATGSGWRKPTANNDE